MHKRKTETTGSRLVRTSLWFCLSAVPLVAALAIIATNGGRKSERAPATAQYIAEEAVPSDHWLAVRIEDPQGRLAER